MRNILIVCISALILTCMSIPLLSSISKTERPVQAAEDPAASKEIADEEEIVKSEEPAEPEALSDSGVKKITVLNGTVILEMEKFTTPFYGISMRFTDKRINMGSGGYVEIRKVENGYAIDGKVYSAIEEGLKDYLKDYLERRFKNFEDRLGPDRKGTYWRAFVDEGKVRLFIDIINGFIDDEFLNAPFNEEWG